MIHEPESLGKRPGATKTKKEKKVTRVVSSSLEGLNRAPLIYDEQSGFFSGNFTKTRIAIVALIFFLIGMIIGIRF